MNDDFLLYDKPKYLKNLPKLLYFKTKFNFWKLDKIDSNENCWLEILRTLVSRQFKTSHEFISAEPNFNINEVEEKRNTACPFN